MTEDYKLVKPSEMFTDKGRFFGKFNLKKYSEECLTILDYPPIRVWGDWYWIRGME